MSERPYQPFYRPYGMTDEQYEYEKRLAEEKLAEWEAEQEQSNQLDAVVSKPILLHGDCLEMMKSLDDNSVDSIVSDPPAGIAFMGKNWDKDKGGRDQWIAWMESVATECLRVIKPGGHALVWALPRTSHWTGMAWENAGWFPKDKIYYAFGTGFPKNLDIGKAIDKRGGKSIAWFGKWFREWREKNNITQKQVAELFPSKTGGLTGCVANWELGFNLPTCDQFNIIKDKFNLPFESIEEAEREVVGRKTAGLGTGKTFAFMEKNKMANGVVNITAPATEAAKQYHGWGNSIKPAIEEWLMFRKPNEKGLTIAENVLKWGTGGIAIDKCRVETEESTQRPCGPNSEHAKQFKNTQGGIRGAIAGQGRWPAQLILDNSEQVESCFPVTGKSVPGGSRGKSQIWGAAHGEQGRNGYTDSGSASRYFQHCTRLVYMPKASKKDRNSGLEGETNIHPTLKSTPLMQYLCRLITPENGTVLDMFMGSGSTGKAAVKEGFDFIGIEKEDEYFEIAEKRITAESR